ncbi:MAG: pyridoxal phosphate-dependent aminotransferase [Chitinophagales bacterium]|nr:pyridoxal phosphate-dependent aminotransferase [Chitinophagales bacterium]
MQQVSERVNLMVESATLKMAQLSRELKAEGKDVIDLSIGEPDFVTPRHIMDAAAKAMDEGFTHYTPVPGYLELRKAIADKLKRDNHIDYTPEEIVVSTGAKQSLINVIMAIVNPGDEVVVPAPYWVSYEAMVQLAEGKMVNIFTDIDQDYKFTAAQLEAAISPKTKALLYSSPCNPSGSVFTKEELEAIARVIAKYPDIIIISDEIYEYITFEGKHESIAQFDFIKNQVVTVNGFSKGYAMTGWRVGYIAAPLWIAKACNKIQGQFTSGTNSIAQKAAEAAIKGDLAPTHAMRDSFLKRRDLVVNLLKEVPGIKTNLPKGAFYVFPNVSSYFGKSYQGETIQDADDFAMYILKHANVSLVSGAAFGNDKCIRISYATSEEKLREAVRRIAEALAKLS